MTVPVGRLAAAERAVPQFAECLVSGFSQVFGMMLGIEVKVLETPSANDGPEASAAIEIEMLDQFRLNIELRVSSVTLTTLSAQLLGCDEVEVTEESALSTAGELANMVAGRLDTWLKDCSVGVHMSLPRATGPDSTPPAVDPPEEEGFVNGFAFAKPDGSQGEVRLYVRVERLVEASP